jgi:hypothetical protein
MKMHPYRTAQQHPTCPECGVKHRPGDDNHNVRGYGKQRRKAAKRLRAKRRRLAVEVEKRGVAVQGIHKQKRRAKK